MTWKSVSQASLLPSCGMDCVAASYKYSLIVHYDQAQSYDYVWQFLKFLECYTAVRTSFNFVQVSFTHPPAGNHQAHSGMVVPPFC